MYHTVSAPDLLELVARHLQVTTRFLKDAPDVTARRQLATTASETATLAGRFSFFDMGQPDALPPYLQLAAQLAREVEDPALEAVALGHLSFGYRRIGDYRGALEALQGAKRLATGQPTIASWAAGLEAMVQAQAGEATVSRTAMDEAEQQLRAAQDAPPVPWFDYYDAARLAGFKGYSYNHLGRPEDAQVALGEALSELDGQADKQRACYLADQAVAYADQGNVEQAAQQGIQALGLLREIDYATGIQRIHHLRAKLKDHSHHAAVGELTEQLLLAS